MTQLDQQRAEHVAVLVDHAADVALQIAAPLQPGIEMLDHRGDMRADRRIVDLEAVGMLDAEFLQLVAHRLVAPDQQRLAIAAVAELDRGAQHHLVLGLGEDHPLGIELGLGIDLGQHRGGRVEPRLEAVAIGVEILDRLLRHARYPSPPWRRRTGPLPSAADRTARG